MDKKNENIPNNYNSMKDAKIYKPEDFRLEFDNLLKKINKDDSNENIQEESYNIDLDFLKNDYLELYDLGKLLNNPQYYLAKFTTRNYYFYKSLSKDNIKEKEIISKTNQRRRKQFLI